MRMTRVTWMRRICGSQCLKAGPPPPTLARSARLALIVSVVMVLGGTTQAMASFAAPSQNEAGNAVAAAPIANAPSDSSSLKSRVIAILSPPDVGATRWGIYVADMQGDPVLSIAADQRFAPASNTKIFVTAAVFDALSKGTFPDQGAGVRIERVGKTPNVTLVGLGDAMMSDKPDCRVDCLVQLARAVKAAGLRTVGDIIGDDSYFPDERWVVSWHARSGSHMVPSALTLDDNSADAEVRPGRAIGQPAVVSIPDLEPEFQVRNDVITGTPDSVADVRVESYPDARSVRLFGTMPAGGEPRHIAILVDDPALYAAIHLARELKALGIRVKGKVRAKHRPLTLADFSTDTSPPVVPAMLAQLTPPSVVEDLTHTAKVSQNLHAQLFLQKLAVANDVDGSSENGLAVVEKMLDRAGIPRMSYDFYDGSGLCPDNRVTPRWVVHFLRWTQQQPWGPAWRRILPVGGRDGTLQSRMQGTILQDNVQAKTGTLTAGVNALAGFVTAKSGRKLVFAIYANDRPSVSPKILSNMDRALQFIAENN